MPDATKVSKDSITVLVTCVLFKDSSTQTGFSKIINIELHLLTNVVLRLSEPLESRFLLPVLRKVEISRWKVQSGDVEKITTSSFSNDSTHSAAGSSNTKGSNVQFVTEADTECWKCKCQNKFEKDLQRDWCSSRGCLRLQLQTVWWRQSPNLMT